MVYMGSKNRFAKYLLPIILKGRKPQQMYVEPFGGGMNMIDKVDGPRMANDLNADLIALWEALVNGWTPPAYIDKKEYYAIKNNPDIYGPVFYAYAGVICSFRGIFFGGFAGISKGKEGKIRNYQEERQRNVAKQIKLLAGVCFSSGSYDAIVLPPNSIIYCDPPYNKTSAYVTGFFNSYAFYQWCRDKAAEGHTVFISEYSAPKDFIEVWSLEVKENLGNSTSRDANTNTEKLFTIF